MSGRRESARRQGPDRHRRARDDLRVGDLPRPRARANRELRDAPRRRPATGSSARRTCTSSPTASRRTTRTSAAVVNPLDAERIPGGSSGGTAPPSPRALGVARDGQRRLDPPPAACCGVVGFKPTWGLVSADGGLPLAPASTRSGRWRARSRPAPPCSARSGSVEEPSTSVRPRCPGRSTPTRSSAPASRRPPRSARIEHVDFPLPGDVNPAFQAEAADVHREHFAEHADSYGENVRKLEAAFDVSDEAVARSRRARDATASRPRALEASTSSSRRRCRWSPARRHRRPRPAGADDPPHAAVQRPGWPALALPCGPRRPPASSPDRRPPATTPRLAVGERLERALAGRCCYPGRRPRPRGRPSALPGRAPRAAHSSPARMRSQDLALALAADQERDQRLAFRYASAKLMRGCGGGRPGSGT